MRIYLPKLKCLAFIYEKATPDFWDKHWYSENIRQEILGCKNDGLFLPYVQKYISKGSRILEGGCGKGHIVNTLMCNGYNSTGIDFAKNTVSMLNKNIPELDIRLDDVRNLSFGNNTFDGYISVGVIEHFWEGYSSIINEMYRVIKSRGGYLFSVYVSLKKTKKFF